MRSLLASFALAVSGIAQGWVDVSPANPGPQASGLGDGTMCYDEVRGVTWLFRTTNNPWTNVYRWDGIQWTLSGQFNAPGNPIFSMWDNVNQNMLVGIRDNSALGLWVWDSQNLVQIPNGSTWSQPNESMAFDRLRGVVVLLTNNGAPATFEWSGGQWSQVSSLTSPPNGYVRTLFFDPVVGRVTCIQHDGSWQGACEYWTWTGTNWVQQYPATSWSRIGQVATSFNPPRNLFFRGNVPNPIGTVPTTNTVAAGVFTQLFLTSYPSSRRDPLLVYDQARDVYVLHGGLSVGGNPMQDTWELDLGPSASYSAFGQGCLGTRGTPSLAPQGSPMPRVGNGFTLQVSNLPWTGPAFMFFGFSNTSYGSTALPFNLGTLGAPQCNLFVSGDVLNPMTNVLGVSTWSFFVPNYPGLVFYNQAFAFDPVANPLGLTTSNAGHGVIGS